MHTSIEHYIEQGRQQGWLAGRQEGEQEGLLKGRQEGRQEGRKEMLLRLLSRKFGLPTPRQRRLVECADRETLLRWSEQVLFAATTEEALR